METNLTEEQTKKAEALKNFLLSLEGVQKIFFLYNPQTSDDLRNSGAMVTPDTADDLYNLGIMYMAEIAGKMFENIKYGDCDNEEMLKIGAHLFREIDCESNIEAFYFLLCGLDDNIEFKDLIETIHQEDYFCSDKMTRLLVYYFSFQNDTQIQLEIIGSILEKIDKYKINSPKDITIMMRFFLETINKIGAYILHESDESDEVKFLFQKISKLLCDYS